MTSAALLSDALSDEDILFGVEAEKTLGEIAARLRAGDIVPYLGPAVVGMSNPAIPLDPEGLAAFFAKKVSLPKRARGNAWAAAQYIESNKLRPTLVAFMTEAFSAPVTPAPLQNYLATLGLPMIVDTWYDSAMRNALADKQGWGEVQGISRAGIGEDRWYRFYESTGAAAKAADASGWKTLLYKPHGCVAPAKHYLISDADYVEVLTEIDIQTPIPEAVLDRRANRGFLFIGCRFHDQMLRTYARQVSKRSAPPHYALIEPDQVLTLNERRFFAAEGIVPLAIPLARACEIIIG
ncbi:SIR2 family protein [Rhodoblastus sphagnicola]|uniref:SIR2 family protein n=1 Tax=Rhodoblastus sphagnicola TaxID=333368 RepID=A0A2S6NE11_9HYPH|nr:SIR2 family protein [Rhodoblastus sphagnicola]MBB4198429.1 hypothetical protein [Rhodoblastus sphagnicola]PPQ32843.1 SIR2 family protein [Rhodoblastus sphagnicola]